MKKYVFFFAILLWFLKSDCVYAQSIPDEVRDLIPIIEYEDIKSGLDAKIDTELIKYNSSSGVYESWVPMNWKGNSSNLRYAALLDTRQNSKFLSLSMYQAVNPWYCMSGNSFYGTSAYVFVEQISGDDEHRPLARSITSNVPIFTNRDDLVDYVLNGNLKNTYNINGYGVESISPDEIGYLTDVKYFVDSAAYQYNPTDTPEYIQWGDKSSTGLDLTDSRYRVEFALEDKSSYYQNTANDYISASGFDPTGQFGSWYREMRNYVGSLVFPSGSNARAVLQGKSVNTAFNGKFISAGSTAASNRQYRISAVARYLNGLSATIEADNLLESSDEWAFRNFLQGYSANPSRGYGGHLAQNISQLGRLYSMSYNIMARIVDSTSGAVGNWTKIDRHNTPYWDGAEEDTLNGRITRTDGYRYNVNNFGDTFVSGGGEDYTTEKKLVVIPVGYWDIDNNIGRPIYNNYNYTTNNYHYDGDINNFVYQDRNGNDSDGTGGIMETIGILGWMSVLLGWYNALFGAVLPSWAQLCIPVFGVIFAAVLVWKFGRSLL